MAILDWCALFPKDMLAGRLHNQPIGRVKSAWVKHSFEQRKQQLHAGRLQDPHAPMEMQPLDRKVLPMQNRC